MTTLNFDKMHGLVPVVVQDYKTHDVLMLAFMDEAAWNKTLETGRSCFYSRTRKKLWIKGETSGNIQIVKEILVDCDRDSVLLRVTQVGGITCHTGEKSCFSYKVDIPKKTKETS